MTLRKNKQKSIILQQMNSTGWDTIYFKQKKPKKPWEYYQQILKVEDGNYNEQDFRNKHDVNEDVMPPEKLQELAGQFLKGME